MIGVAGAAQTFRSVNRRRAALKGCTRATLKRALLGLPNQLPDDGEMVIIVFRREEQMIDEPHRLLQPRVQHRTAEGVGRQRADAIQQPPARRAELREELPDIARVVIRFVGLAVAQVGGGQRVAARDEVVHPRRPERLEIKQMAGVLLRGPFVAGLAHQDVAWNAAHDLLQPCGRAAEPDAEVGILVDGERELECAFEPGGDVAHPFSLVVSLRAAPTGIDTIDRAYYTGADGDG